MKNSEFIALLIANTDKTRNIRTFSKHWMTGASRVPDEVTEKIGCVISLIQTLIDANQLCKKDSEYILIYNFQPLKISEEQIFCELSTVVRPISQIKETKEIIGNPMQFVVNGKTGEVMNNTQGMLELKVITQEELAEDSKIDESIEKPKIYGNYHEFHPQCCFMPIVSYKPVDEKDIFESKYDKSEMIQKALVFDSLSEARKFLKERSEVGRYILEFPFPKEIINDFRKKEIGKEAIKIINYQSNEISVNPNPLVYSKAEQIEVEVEQLKSLSPRGVKASAST